MRFVILGSGGRENAIIQKLYSENKNYNLVCISNIINPDIKKITSEYHVLNPIDNLVHPKFTTLCSVPELK